MKIINFPEWESTPKPSPWQHLSMRFMYGKLKISENELKVTFYVAILSESIIVWCRDDGRK